MALRAAFAAAKKSPDNWELLRHLHTVPRNDIFIYSGINDRLRGTRGSVLFFEQGQIFPVSFLFQFFDGDESQGCRVHTVAQTCRRGTIVEKMS
jgi:hypothetical protein